MLTAAAPQADSVVGVRKVALTSGKFVAPENAPGLIRINNHSPAISKTAMPHIQKAAQFPVIRMRRMRKDAFSRALGWVAHSQCCSLLQ